MATSYDKVSELCCKTVVWDNYVYQVRRRLETLHISTATFDVKSDPHNPKPYFRVRFDGDPQEHSVWRSERGNIPGFKVDWDWVTTHEEAVHIINRIWADKAVPTYNCRLEKSKKAAKGQNSMQGHFPQFARDRLTVQLAAEHEFASKRLAGIIMEWYDDPDFAKKKAVAIERTAIDEIRGALMKYRHLDELVLRTAFNEFVTEDVLTC